MNLWNQNEFDGVLGLDYEFQSIRWHPESCWNFVSHLMFLVGNFIRMSFGIFRILLGFCVLFQRFVLAFARDSFTKEYK